VRSLEFLEFTPQTLAPPPPFLPPLLPLCLVAGRRRSPPLQLCRRHLLPLAAPTRRRQAGRHPNPSPLAFSRACHAAPPLSELYPAATSPPSWLAPCVPPPPFFSGPRPSVASPPSNLLSLAFAFHPEPRIHHCCPLFVSNELCSPWADHPSPSRSTTAPSIASP
jgi:hypothetical protein